jgi:transposase-like protein
MNAYIERFRLEDGATSATKPTKGTGTRRHLVQAQQAQQQWTEKEKTEHLALFAESGLELAAFCKEMGLSETVLASWLEEARENVSGGAPRFVPVELVASPAMSATQGVLQGPSLHVRMPNGTEAQVTGLDHLSSEVVALLLREMMSGIGGYAGSACSR